MPSIVPEGADDSPCAASHTADPASGRHCDVEVTQPETVVPDIMALAESATAWLATDPPAAERILRRILIVGADTLSPEQLARVNSLVVTAISGQPGREPELVAAALAAAAAWVGLSPADVAHHTLLAARLHLSAGRYGAAADLFACGLAESAIPYPAPEIAALHRHYGYCLTRLCRHRAAARVFAAGARVIAADPACQELYAELLSAAAGARTAARLLRGPRGVVGRLLRREDDYRGDDYRSGMEEL
jgi:hypothetical protein